MFHQKITSKLASTAPASAWLCWALGGSACSAPAVQTPPGSQAGVTEQTTPSAAPLAESAALAPSSPTEAGSAKADSSEARQPLPLPEGTKVLHVGDSFAGALGLPLSKLLEENSVRSVLKHTDSSYLTDWAWDGNLQKYIWKYNPDLVIVTLGANELGIGEPERREKTVKKIISVIGERPCVWVAIPLWKGKQNGLMDVIERSVAPCVFMDTNQLIDVDAMPRIHDGIHPTTEAREEWAAFVLDWLQEHRAPGEEKVWALRE